MHRVALAFLILAGAGAPTAAAPPGWTHLSDDVLSLDASPGAVLKHVAPQTWELHDRRLTLGIAYGPKVADADDAEPRRCYSTEIVLFDGGGGVLRVTRPTARIDCPDGYASLYRPPAKPGAPALFVWAWAGSEDLATVRGVIASIRFAP